MPPRTGVIASTSSKKMMHGAAVFAFRNVSRTIRSDSPTHLLMNSGPRTEMKFASASVATAFASHVFPVPGGPKMMLHRGGRGPKCANSMLMTNGHSIEPARPAQRRIERVRPVRGADDDDLAARLQAVHQGEQLCDDPPLDLARDLVSLRRNRVQFVDEDDARGFLLGLFENVPQVLFALPVELGHDLRPGDRMEVRIRLRCDGLGEEGLARPRGTVQEDPFRRFDAEPLEQLRMP